MSTVQLSLIFFVVAITTGATSIFTMRKAVTLKKLEFFDNPPPPEPPNNLHYTCPPPPEQQQEWLPPTQTKVATPSLPQEPGFYVTLNGQRPQTPVSFFSTTKFKIIGSCIAVVIGLLSWYLFAFVA